MQEADGKPSGCPDDMESVEERWYNELGNPNRRSLQDSLISESDSATRKFGSVWQQRSFEEPNGQDNPGGGTQQDHFIERSSDYENQRGTQQDHFIERSSDYENQRGTQQDHFIEGPSYYENQGGAQQNPFIEGLSDYGNQGGTQQDPFIEGPSDYENQGGAQHDPFIEGPSYYENQGGTQQNPFIEGPSYYENQEGAQQDPFIEGPSNDYEDQGRTQQDPFIEGPSDYENQGGAQQDPFIEGPSDYESLGGTQQDPFTTSYRDVHESRYTEATTEVSRRQGSHSSGPSLSNEKYEIKEKEDTPESENTTNNKTKRFRPRGRSGSNSRRESESESRRRVSDPGKARTTPGKKERSFTTPKQAKGVKKPGSSIKEVKASYRKEKGTAVTAKEKEVTFPYKEKQTPTGKPGLSNKERPSSSRKIYTVKELSKQQSQRGKGQLQKKVQAEDNNEIEKSMTKAEVPATPKGKHSLCKSARKSSAQSSTMVSSKNHGGTMGNANVKRTDIQRKNTVDLNKGRTKRIVEDPPSICEGSVMSITFSIPLNQDEALVYLRTVLGDLPFGIRTDVCCSLGEFVIVFPRKDYCQQAMEVLSQVMQDSCIQRVFLLSPEAPLRRQLISKRRIAVVNHGKRTEVVSGSIDELAIGKGKGKGKGKNKFLDFNVFEKIQTLKQKKEEYDRQLDQFTRFCDEVICGLETDSDINNIELTALGNRFEREQNRLENALPIYAKKSDIVETVRSSQVCIVVGETGSGKSTQMVQYLYDAGFAQDGQIVCTQPRKVAATSLAQQVSKEMRCKIGSLVGYRVGSSRKTNKDTKVLYTTDHALLMECIKDNALSNYSCILIDEAHERSINTDLLLGIIKKALPSRPNLRVIITSATIDPSLFQNFFGGCPVIKVSGRTFPVDVIWKQSEQVLGQTDNYVMEAVNKAVEIHRDEEEGDVLVFLTSPAEIDQARDKLASKLNPNEVVCLPLHGKLQQEDQQKVFQPYPGKRKIVLSTNCAETSITIPGIKFVVDTGRAKEMKYDEKRGINILEVSVISRSSADQRKGRAGRTDSGKCYRLYAQEAFEAMEKGTRPEILRVHLGQAIVKLMELGVSNPVEFDYVEPPPKDSITQALTTLVKLGAVRDGKLTELGRKISRVPIEPRLAKFLFKGIDDEVGFESLVICSVATVNGSVFFRMGTDSEKKEADVRKVEFCQPEGDFLTLLAVYREYWNEDPRDRGRWCFDKSLNAKALRMAEETMKELKFALEYDLDMKLTRGWKWSAIEETAVNEILGRNILSCFSENLCVFSGHSRVGFKTVNGGHYVKLHPSTSLNFIGAEPKFLVYEKTLRTSQDFILNVTPIDERWVHEALREIDIDLDKVNDEMLFPVQINCSQVLRKMMLSPFKEKRDALQRMLQGLCNESVVFIESKPDSGVVEIFIPRKHHESTASAVNEYLDEGRNRLRSATREHPVSPRSQQEVRMVFGNGCAVHQILMTGMYRSVVARYSCNEVDPREIMKVLQQFGTLIEYKVLDAVIFALYENPEDAERAVWHCRTGQEGFTVDVPKFGRQRQRKEDQGICLDVKISWNRRLPSGRASIDFSRNPDYHTQMVFSSYRRVNNMAIGSSVARVSADKHRPNSVFIQNLNKETTKLDIKTAVEAKYSGIVIEDVNKQIFLQYERRLPSSEIEDMEKQTRTLEELIKDVTEGGNFLLTVRKPMKETDITANAFVKFRNPMEGVNAAKELNGTTVCDLEEWDVKLEVTCYLNSLLTCPKFIYDAVKSEIENEMERVSRGCCEKCEGRVKAATFPAKSKGRIAIKIESQCMEHYAEATMAVGNTIKGEKIDCSTSETHKILLTKTGREVLKDIEKTTGALIRADDRDAAIYIYGSAASKDDAYLLIQAHLQDMILTGCKLTQINLRESDRPKGLLKEMMRRFGRDLAGLSTVEGVYRVSADIKTHTLTLYSTPEACQGVLDEIAKAGTELPQTEEAGVEVNECPVCFCEVDKPSYRLASCGQEYCHACAKSQIEAKQFPLKCSQENCQDVFTLTDVDLVLLQEAEREDVIRAALDWYVKTNQDKARHCPSPDCPMVYRVTSDGKPFKCCVCSNVVCTTCHETNHMGLTCEERKLAENEHGQDLLMERWMKADPKKRKRCPKCQTGIEKSDGCNHMICEGCKTHMCWLCLKVYNSSDEVYSHLPFCKNNNV